MYVNLTRNFFNGSQFSELYVENLPASQTFSCMTGEFDLDEFLTNNSYIVDMDKDAVNFNPREYEVAHSQCEYFPRSPHPLPSQIVPDSSSTFILTTPREKTVPADFPSAFAAGCMVDLLGAFAKQRCAASGSASLSNEDAITLNKLTSAVQQTSRTLPKVPQFPGIDAAYEANSKAIEAVRAALERTDDIPDFDPSRLSDISHPGSLARTASREVDIDSLPNDGIEETVLDQMLSVLKV